MTLYDPWMVLAALIGPPFVVAAEVLILAALPKQVREIVMVVEAVLLICFVPQALFA